ncbi:SDR family NAD(P)-dependent oxidoreductase [Millisia brevis]|uniref:SDR family NAD(P)-dependent oxidoreductase n=1 Tax=Millisia brevis TaxID=264148 RepID=UPI000836638A|nr:SDR family NAD(P)-dependent oxidoreductase [Millisia brevis]
MIARTAQKLDVLTETLRSEGISAAGFRGNVSRPDSLVDALTAAKDTVGPIDVLEFSPSDPGLPIVGVLDITPENLQPQIDFFINGAIAAVKAVLPDMRERGTGTILIGTGGGSINPVPSFAGITLAGAGLGNWVLNLHNTLGPEGIYVAHVAISAWIGKRPSRRRSLGDRRVLPRPPSHPNRTGVASHRDHRSRGLSRAESLLGDGGHRRRLRTRPSQMGDHLDQLLLGGAVLPGARCR